MTSPADPHVFESCARSAADLAGVFDHDGTTGYFYLYSPRAPSGHRILSALRVMSESTSFDRAAIEVRWDATETAVGLFVDGELWAAFDGSTGAGFTGDYGAGIRPELPSRIRAALLGR